MGKVLHYTTLACIQTRHMKIICVVCRTPKTLYGNIIIKYGIQSKFIISNLNTAGVTAKLLPKEVICVTLICLPCFMLNMSSFNVWAPTIRKETGRHDSFVKNLMEQSIFLLLYVFIVYLYFYKYCMCFGIPLIFLMLHKKDKI